VASAATRLARRLPFSYRRFFSPPPASAVIRRRRRLQAQLEKAHGVGGVRFSHRDSRQTAALGPQATERSRCARPDSLDTTPFADAAARRGDRIAEEPPRFRTPAAPRGSKRPKRFAPRLGFRKNTTCLENLNSDLRLSNGGFSRDAPGAALAFLLPTFLLYPTASAVTGAKPAASTVRL